MAVNVAAEEAGKPDVADVDRAMLETRHSDAALSSAADAFDVVIPRAAWDEMQRHARTRLDAEVGGVLIGRPVATENAKPYLVIDAGIPALAADSRQTNVTFTAEAWTLIHEIIDRDHPGAAIVGWYHTHPAFGIFLSEMDLFIQRHFFDLPHQVAIVIDPVAKTHGCFIWRAGHPTLGPLLIEGAEAPAPVIPPPPKPEAVAAERIEPAHELHRPWERRRSIGQWRQRLVEMIDPLMRLDRTQWVALLALLAITAVLFGALGILLFQNPAPLDAPSSTTSTTQAGQPPR